MCDNNGDTFITTLHDVLLAPDICNGLFSIIILMNFGYTCFFQNVFFTFYFGNKDKNAVTLPYSTQRKHAFLGGIKKMSKTKKLASRKKIDLELLHQILGQRSTR